MALESFLTRFRQACASLDLTRLRSILPENEIPHLLQWNRTMRLWCGIIDAMTRSERCNPLVVLDESRVSRVARGSGTSIDGVWECIVYCFEAFELGFVSCHHSPSINRSRDWKCQVQFSTELCETTHASLLVGTCPWCGCAIVPEP